LVLKAVSSYNGYNVALPQLFDGLKDRISGKDILKTLAQLEDRGLVDVVKRGVATPVPASALSPALTAAT
jgi:hypothetical protein